MQIKSTREFVIEYKLSRQNDKKIKKQKAKRLLVMISLGTCLITGLSWLALQPFPSVRTKVVFSIFGCGFLALAAAAMKTGIAPYRWGPVERRDEAAFFYVLVVGEIVAGILMIFFGWTL